MIETIVTASWNWTIDPFIKQLFLIACCYCIFHSIFHSFLSFVILIYDYNKETTLSIDGEQEMGKKLKIMSIILFFYFYFILLH